MEACTTRLLSILVALLVCPVIASAQSLDKDRLRKAAYLPYMGMGVSIKTGDIDDDGRKYDPARAIAALSERLTGGVDDAATHLDLANCYKDAGQEIERKKALEKAEELPATSANERPAASPPSRLLCSLSRRLASRPGEERRGSSGAVEIAPDDWRCWESLGRRVAQPAFALLAKDATDSFDVNEFTSKVLERCRRPRERISWVDAAPPR